tara:strand:+ start:291 stop:473 length:183 start_codon:yes stop_codon:yes gene_type:complete
LSEVELTRKDFRAFAEVRKSGLYNMFDPRAREMTHLSREQWIAIMEQYAELENKYKENGN